MTDSKFFAFIMFIMGIVVLLTGEMWWGSIGLKNLDGLVRYIVGGSISLYGLFSMYYIILKENMED
jgi:hypothetical protein